MVQLLLSRTYLYMEKWEEAAIYAKKVMDNSKLSKCKPEESLLAPHKVTAGRNAQGRVTARHRGGGHKRQYRIIDWRRDKDNIPARVATIEYDPNRSAHIALLNYVDGEKRYILAANNMKVGDKVISGDAQDIKVGNAMMLHAGDPVGFADLQSDKWAKKIYVWIWTITMD